MNITCPHCDLTLSLSPEYAGQRMSCPTCKGIFDAPVPTAGSAINRTLQIRQDREARRAFRWNSPTVVALLVTAAAGLVVLVLAISMVGSLPRLMGPKFPLRDQYLDKLFARGAIRFLAFNDNTPRLTVARSETFSEALASVGREIPQGKFVGALLVTTGKAPPITQRQLREKIGEPTSVREERSLTLGNTSKIHLHYGSVQFRIIMDREYQPQKVLVSGPELISIDVKRFASER